LLLNRHMNDAHFLQYILSSEPLQSYSDLLRLTQLVKDCWLSDFTKYDSKALPIHLAPDPFATDEPCLSGVTHMRKDTLHRTRWCVLSLPLILCRLTPQWTADEGGATKMSGGISWLTLPAGYLGSSFIGACLIACGFNTNASKVASLVLAVFFLFTLWWARRNWLWVFILYRMGVLSWHSFFSPDSSWVLIVGMSGLFVLFWLVAGGVALRYFVLFIGVMSCMYVVWDVIGQWLYSCPMRSLNSWNRWYPSEESE